MPVHRVTRSLTYWPHQLADLVADVESYPSFVKWVTAMRVTNTREEAPGITVMDAEAQVGFAFLKERFSTRVRYDRNIPRVDVQLIRGPFKHLTNSWTFQKEPHGTRLDFMIDFDFKSLILNRMFEANFDRAVDKLMRSFEAEAKRRYRKKA